MRKLKAGDLFHERFSIIEELGAGGMGVVYHALQSDVSRHVALKLLNLDRIGQEGESERFLREFQILSKLSHQNIMSFYLLGMTAEDIPYAACEYLDGKSLQRILNEENKLNWRRVLKISVQIADALSFAHKQEIIHRDLKPANIIIMDRPEPDFVKVIDFGLARIVEDASDKKLTFTGELVGSVHYMSPEQCQGKKPDQACDIYALACLIFETLSGEKLFDAANPIGIIHLQCNASAKDRIAMLQGKCPDRMLQLLNQMLSKSPADRPDSMESISRTLREMDHDGVTISLGLPANAMSRHAGLGQNSSIRSYIPHLMVLLILACSGLSIFYFVRVRSNSEAVKQMTEPLRSKTIPRNGETLLDLADSYRRQGLEKEEEAIVSAWWEKYGKSELPSPSERAAVLRRLANIARSRQDRAKSRDLLMQAMNILRKSKDDSVQNSFDKVNVLAGLCVANMDETNKAGALEVLKEAISEIEKRTDSFHPAQLGSTQDCVSRLAGIGELSLALATIKKITPSLVELASLREASLNRLLTGDLNACFDDFKTASTNYKTSFDLLKRECIRQETDSESKFLPGVGIGRPSNSLDVNGIILVDIGQRLSYLEQENGIKMIKDGLHYSIREAELGRTIDAGIWMKLSTICAKFKLDENGLFCVRKAISEYEKLYPEQEKRDASYSYVVAHYSLLPFLVRLGRFDKAVEEYKTWLGLFRKHKSYSLLGQIGLDFALAEDAIRKDKSKAKFFWEKTKELFANVKSECSDPEVFAEMAFLYDLESEPSEEYWKISLDKFRSGKAAMFSGGNTGRFCLALAKGDRPELLDVVDSKSFSDDTSASANKARARCLCRLGEIEFELKHKKEAKQFLEKAFLISQNSFDEFRWEVPLPVLPKLIEAKYSPRL